MVQASVLHPAEYAGSHSKRKSIPCRCQHNSMLACTLHDLLSNACCMPARLHELAVKAFSAGLGSNASKLNANFLGFAEQPADGKALSYEQDQGG